MAGTSSTRWYCSRKNGGENGQLTRYKAQIVARGDTQSPEDYGETFASVARFSTLRALLAVAAELDWEVDQIDVVGAYLQGDLDEEIYARLPEGVSPKRGKFWKLKRPLYGLKQGGNKWEKKRDDVLAKLGFEKSSADPSLYTLRDGSRHDGAVKCIALFYVDDGLLAGPDRALIDDVSTKLNAEFEITRGGPARYILGIQIRRDRASRSLDLSQSAYIRDVLTRFGMQDANPLSIPLQPRPTLSSTDSPSTPAEKAQYHEQAKGLKYISMVGAVLYATQTRPDIQYAVTTLAQFSANPGIKHLEAMKRLLRYLRGTADFKLHLGRRPNSGINLVGWTDSDWAGDIDTRRSVGGFVFDVAGSSITWSSKKQPTVALSTVEAEYMAASNATKEAIWLRTLLADLGHPQMSATIIHADNQGCIALSRNPVAHSRAKHIDIRHHFIRERIARSEIDLQFLSTKEMVADIFTKALPRDLFERFQDALGVGA